MPGNVIAPAKAREALIEARVIRADGSVEHLGVVSYWHRNPLRRALWRVRRWLKGV